MNRIAMCTCIAYARWFQNFLSRFFMFSFLQFEKLTWINQKSRENLIPKRWFYRTFYRSFTFKASSGANGASFNTTWSNFSIHGSFLRGAASSSVFCFKPATLFVNFRSDFSTTVFNPGFNSPAAKASCSWNGIIIE